MFSIFASNLIYMQYICDSNGTRQALKLLRFINNSYMNKRYLTIILFFSISLAIIPSCSDNGKEKTWYVYMETSMGNIKLKLYNNTPQHRDNFIKLIKEKYYDNIIFHRVIDNFMIQTGDYHTMPDLASDTTGRYDYTIPAEINETNFHKRGALAAARTGDRFNPFRESSGTQFYIVQGRVYNDQITETGDTISGDKLISDIEKRINSSLKQNIFYRHLENERRKSVQSRDGRTDPEIQEAATLLTYSDLEKFVPVNIPEEHVEVYKSTGGTPHLDMQYTVFGEVVEGMDIVDKIAAVSTDRSDRPVEDIVIIKARLKRK